VSEPPTKRNKREGMKRQRRKERKDHANQPGVTATGRGQETQEERIQGQSAKRKG
jgi:hypothetical protein